MKKTTLLKTGIIIILVIVGIMHHIPLVKPARFTIIRAIYTGQESDIIMMNNGEYIGNTCELIVSANGVVLLRTWGLHHGDGFHVAYGGRVTELTMTLKHEYGGITIAEDEVYVVSIVYHYDEDMYK